MDVEASGETRFSNPFVLSKLQRGTSVAVSKDGGSSRENVIDDHLVTIHYRDATTADAPAISELFAESFTATFGHLYGAASLAQFLADASPARFAEEIADPAYAVHLAFDGDRLAGFVKLGPAALPIESPPGTLELRQLYLRDAYKGTGVAAALTEWVFAEARRRDASHIDLTVYIDNHRARRFYERYGFVEIGRYEFRVGDHVDDDRIMRLKL